MIVPRHVLGGPGYLAPSDEITLGFIGLGRQGKGLGNRFAKLAGCRILAGSDVDATKQDRFLKLTNEAYAESRGQTNYQACTRHRDFEEVLGREDIDAVVIATPDHWHGVQGVMAMKAGKDVYLEKPLTLTVKEGQALVKAADKYERVFQTGSMQRSRENFLHACELVRNGYIGDIKEVLVCVGGGPPSPCELPTLDPKRDIDWDKWIGPASYRGYHDDLAPPIPEQFWPRWRHYSEFGGGMISDWGAHMFDIAQWGLGMDGSGPVRLEPLSTGEKPEMLLTYTNGIPMKQTDFGRGNAVRFIGSEGTIDISRSFLETTPANLKDHQLSDNEIRLYRSENHYEDWLQAIRNRTQPICDVRTGHSSATVCNITNIAYALNRPLDWNPDKEKFVKDKEANAMLSRPIRGDWKLR